jgi:PAS domain S-box-containing protein
MDVKKDREKILLEDLTLLESYLRDLFFFLPIPVCLVSSIGIILEVNLAFEEISGYKIEEAIGKPIEALFIKEEIKEILKETFEKGFVKEREINFFTKDKRKILVSVSTKLRKSEEGEIIGYFISFFDLSNIKKIESELQNKLEELNKAKETEMILRIREMAKAKDVERKVEELEKARKALMNILEDIEEAKKKAEEEKNKTLAIVENFVDGLLIFDKDRRLVSMNPQAEIFLKLKKEEIIGKSIEDLKEIPEFKKIFEIVGLEIEPCFREELKMEENLILEVTSLPILLEKEKIGNLIILHDITREKYIDQLKTEFVSLAAHQLRTPLSGIKWSLKMILDEDLGPVPEGLKDFLKKALLSNERLIHLVNDLLDVTRIEEGKFLYKLEEKDVVKIVENVFNSYLDLAKEKNIEFKLEKLKDDFPLIKVDEEKIKLVIQNLIENALIYTLPKGKVTVTIDLQNGNFFFKIQDTGIGIPKEVQDRIFTKFFRASNAAKIDTEGSGLGLFVTKNIVESHGGKIWFESEEGKGTTFYFTIPVKKEEK